MSQEVLDNCFQDWQEREALAEAMIPLIGQLYRKNNVVTSLYGRAMVNQSVIRIMKDHRFVRQVEGTELSVRDTHPILETMARLNLGPAHVDIGKLAVKFKAEGGDLEAFLRKELESAVDQHQDGADDGYKDVVLYGFGRIGRLLARILVEKAGGGNKLRLRAIVVRGGKEGDLQKRASLLRRDSVHGSFQGTIAVDEDAKALIINGNYVQMIYANSPAEVDYTT